MNNKHREIVLPEAQLQLALRRKSRRGFLVGGLAALGAVGAYKAVRLAPKDDYVPWPQRDVLNFNGKLWHSYLNDAHLMPTYSLDQVGYLKPNGDHGLYDDSDGKAPELDLRVEVAAGTAPVSLSLDDIRALPKQELITKFCCIEGWSTIAHWGGARFSDFTRKYFPLGRTLPRYVYMATDGEDYFVGLDMKSALHPQTLLAWEKDGKPLASEHGAPLRLVIPVKYGIKNIKNISLIRYTDIKPRDYWAGEGYDWFAGL